MSTPGATFELNDLPPGAEWALIAESHFERASGIMAASEGIADVIAAGDIDLLCIFPDSDPGIYLWFGTVDQAQEGEGGVWTPLHPLNMLYWLEHSGEPV